MRSHKQRLPQGKVFVDRIDETPAALQETTVQKRVMVWSLLGVEVNFYVLERL